jgi:hypothetical protein
VLGGDFEEAGTIRKNQKVVLKVETLVSLEQELREETGLGIIDIVKAHCPKKVKEFLQAMANIVTISKL